MSGVASKIVTGALLSASVLALFAAAPVPQAHAQRADGQAVQTPGRAPLTFADIADKVKPSVVSISVTSGGAPRTAAGPQDKRAPNAPGARPAPGQGPSIPGLPDELQEFFRNLPREFGGGGNGPARPSQAQGSGFVISEDGYVVTNNHVIDKATKIQVTFDNAEKAEKYDAELVGTDPRTDVALLKIKSDRKNFPAVKFADKPSRVGDWVIAVGNPFGLGGTVTAGIVSALARGGISEGPYDFIQIDAAVNRGNSGGPTFNLDGEVIGVNTAIYSPSGGNVGIAFAVPAATTKKVVEQLKSTGSVARGWLGVKIQNLDESMAKSFGLPDTAGALIQEVTANGPAQTSGLKAEDVILSVAGTKIKDTKDLALKIAEYAPNTTVDVRVMRSDKEETIKVKLGRFPGANDEVAKVDPNASKGPTTKQASSLGLTFSTGAAAAAKRGAGGGVQVVEVEEGTDAATKGIANGDIVTHVNGDAVSTVEEIEAAVKKASRGVVRLTVKSQNQTAVIAVNVKKG